MGSPARVGDVIEVGCRGLTADDLLWNWARWCWSGGGTWHMEEVEDDYRPINTDHAVAVQGMHAELPHHERMIIIAEYPQKRVRFADLDAATRCRSARAWIRAATGVELNEAQYKLYLGFFKEDVARRLL